MYLIPPKRFYYLKDHLGSIRVVVNEAGEIVSSDDYDPWGMILNGRSTNGSYLNAKYKFTGKERDVETNSIYLMLTELNYYNLFNLSTTINMTYLKQVKLH